jgi:Condensation domain
MRKFAAYLGQGVHLRYFDVNPHFNGIGEILLAEEKLDNVILARAVDSVVRRHDSLRVGFTMDKGGYFQEAHPETSTAVFEFVEVAKDCNESPAELLATKAEEILAWFDIFQSRLIKVVLVRFEALEQDRLIILANHLICDGYSFHLLWRNICSEYRALQAGRGSSFGQPATSLAEFTSWLEGHCLRPGFSDRLNRWVQMNAAGTISIPRHPSTSCTADVHANSKVLSCCIDKFRTAQLEAKIQGTYHSFLHHAVMAAFLSVFAARYGTGMLPLGIWTSGHFLRAVEDAVPEFIGFCAFPVFVCLDLFTAEFSSLLALVDSTIAEITTGGAAFGLAMFHEGRPDAWLAPLREIALPQVSFNYFAGLELGRYAIQTRPAPEKIARVKYPGNKRFREISIDYNVADGALCIQVEFSHLLHSSEEMRVILDEVESLLHQISCTGKLP